MELSVKDKAKELISLLPESASWEDIQHEIYVRQSIEKGLEDSLAGRVQPVTSVRKKFNLA